MMFQKVSRFTKTVLIFIACFMLLCLSGCASFYSKKPKVSEAVQSNGLDYHMPKRDIVVTIAVVAGAVTTVTITRSEAYPDLSTHYQLTPGNNWLGKSTMRIQIAGGLLSTANSNSESGVQAIATSVATGAGQLGAGMTLNGPPSCADDSTNRYVVPVSTANEPVCGLNLSVVKEFNSTQIPMHATARSENLRAGVFYRLDLPYRVTVSGTSTTTKPTQVNMEEIVFSPTESNDLFLPVSRSFFGSNEAIIALNRGTPTDYGQIIDGELVGLLKLPADIFSAYFAAVGSTFDVFRSNDEKEAAALNQEIQLQLQRLKFEACISAIASNDTTQIEALEC